AMYIGLAAYFVAAGGPLQRWLVLAAGAALAGSFLVSYVRARAQSLGFTCETGLFARPERIVVTVVGLVLGGYIPLVLYLVVFLLAFLTNLTAVADPFARIVGHAQALSQLRAQLDGDRLAHAYLFVGESGLGKSTTARALAAALLPEAPLDRHPDYWEDDRIKPLSINEIRLLPDKPPEFHELSLQAFLNLKPGVASRRVALVVNVGRLRDQDQGVLLKTVEEPHPHRVIILTTPSLNPFVVLPTVVSRCLRVFFHPV